MLAAFDAKEYRRGGSRKPARLGEPPGSRGFFSQLGAGIVLEDERQFRGEYERAFRELAKAEGIRVLPGFCSSFVLRRHFAGDNSRALAFADALLARVAPLIRELHLSYLYLGPGTVGTVRVGGRKGPVEELSAPHFVRRAGNFMPVLSAWWYLKAQGTTPADTIVLDSVELPEILAWSELVGSVKPSIIPSGDECFAPLAAADTMAWVTDMRLSQARQLLNPTNLRAAWTGQPFDVHCFYFNEKFLYAMKWVDNAPVRVGAFWRRPMTYFLVDPLLLEATAERGEEAAPGTVRLRDWVEEGGWMDAIFAHAQHVGGGAKGFNPGDRGFVQDGDFLVYVGEESRRRAEALSDVVDVTVLPLKELRKNLKTP